MKFRRALMHLVDVAEERVSDNVGRELLVAVDIDEFEGEGLGQLEQRSERDEMLSIRDIVLELRLLSPIRQPPLIEIIESQECPASGGILDAWPNGIKRRIPFRKHFVVQPQSIAADHCEHP